MFLPGRLFNSKNRRTPLQMIPRRLSGQSIDDQIRALHAAWGDVLSLPLCLSVLALYEWWRWLFTIPSNPILLTFVAAVAIHVTWRRRKVYKADLKQLRPGRPVDATVREVIGLLRIMGTRVMQDMTNKLAPATVLASARRILSPANWLAKRLTARF